MSEVDAAVIATAYWTKWLVWATVFLGVTTLALGAVAIWGDWAKVRWLRPKLTLALKSAEGMNEVSARYYRLLVTNRAYARATSVEVHLLRVEQVVSGARSTLWASEIPLKWMNDLTRDKAPTLSRDAPEVCDLFCVGSMGLRITTESSPPHSLDAIMRWPEGTPAHLILTVEARSDEARSGPVSIEVNWGGAVLPGDAEMARSLHVKLLPDSRA